MWMCTGEGGRSREHGTNSVGGRQAVGSVV